MIGFMVNCILPGRIGEIVRPIVLNRNQSIPVSTGLATVVVERFFDLVILLLLFMVMSTTFQVDPEMSLNFSGYHIDHKVLSAVFRGMLQLGGLLIAGLSADQFFETRQMLKRAVLAAPEFIPLIEGRTRARLTTKISAPVAAVIDNIAAGMALIKEPKRIVVCFFYSLAVWFVTALSYYVFSLGCPEVTLTFSEMTAVMVIICFAIALPSVPGYWGLWEAGGIFAMFLFGVAENDAAGFTLANHVAQVIPVVMVGLVSAWASGVNIRRVYSEH